MEPGTPGLRGSGNESQELFDSELVDGGQTIIHTEATPFLTAVKRNVSIFRPGITVQASASWHGEGQYDGLPWWQKPSVYWLLPPFVLYTLAFGGVIVPKFNLILELLCHDYFAEKSIRDPNFSYTPVIFGGNKNDQCRIPEVQALVSQFTLYTQLLAGVASAIVSPKLGQLSDRYGRKRFIAISALGNFLGECITLVVAINPRTISVYWLLFGSLLDGICGSFTSVMALTHSYGADCTSPSKRNVAFAYFHGALFTGIALGPILAALIIKATNIVTIFYIALACHLIFIFWILVVAPESLTKERQAAAREKHESVEDNAGWTNKISSLFSPLLVLYPTGEGSSTAVRLNLMLLATVDALMFAVVMGSVPILVYYSEYKFGWKTLETSAFVSIVNTSRVCILVLVLPFITYLVKGRRSIPSLRNLGSDWYDLAIIRVAVFFDMVGFLGYALSSSGTMLTVSGIIASVGGVGSPTLQSALTKHVPPERTGQLLGAMGLLHSLGRVLGPVVFNMIYSQTVASLPETVWICLAATFGIAFVLSWFIRPRGK
ncbi:MAG: hypothetical protein M1829_002069 [Trizodia sp. TS-e1964]|nr:MAG: hypothetical protein M1829_002069 [Trizodia sp. TS-e1964]